MSEIDMLITKLRLLATDSVILKEIVESNKSDIFLTRTTLKILKKRLKNQEIILSQNP